MDGFSFVALVAVCSFVCGAALGAWGLAKFVNAIRRNDGERASAKAYKDQVDAYGAQVVAATSRYSAHGPEEAQICTDS